MTNLSVDSKPTEVIEEWCKRLESGEIPQTQGYLNRLKVNETFPDDGPVGMCCLGVLSEMAAGAGVIEPGEPDSAGELMSYNGRTAFPSEPVLRGTGGVTA